METDTTIKADPEFTPEQLAERWGLSVQTLMTWRSRKWHEMGKGPAFNKRGRVITYSLSDIIAYEIKEKRIPGKKSDI